MNTPVKPQRLYYIQNTGFTGNCLKWWKTDGHGYTLDLSQAWKVPEGKAKQIVRSRPHEDIMWPVEEIDAASARHVNCETLAALRSAGSSRAARE